jgi:hypothetical protein
LTGTDARRPSTRADTWRVRGQEGVVGLLDADVREHEPGADRRADDDDRGEDRERAPAARAVAGRTGAGVVAGSTWRQRRTSRERPWDSTGTARAARARRAPRVRRRPDSSTARMRPDRARAPPAGR